MSEPDPPRPEQPKADGVSSLESDSIGTSISEHGLDAGIAAGLEGAQAQGTPSDWPARRLVAGSMINDRYRLVEPIGSGGMGTVWRADQLRPVKRQVAIKLIKPGMDSALVLARFDAERQALALMDHPSIAKVYDGGLTEFGNPYFVMELVRGTAITEFCDQRRLTLQERLGLMVQACHAMHHAHQKGVIHRDIKPSNLMVALYDDVAVPKIIDFGVAKATGVALTDATLNTGFGHVVGTPEYMSPEQALLNNADIDTRSDVYSLGTLLYELVAGSPPFRRSELAENGLHEILRVIREMEPSRPSAKLSSSKFRASIAAARHVEPHVLDRMLRSELDWIVLKSLDKNRARRYDSALAFANDLQRYLNHEAVEACPPTVLYRIRKQLWRYRWGASVACILLFALLAGILGTSIGMYRSVVALKRANEAEQRANDLVELERVAKKEAQAQRLLAEKAEDEAIESYRASVNDSMQRLIGSRESLGPAEKAYLDNALKRWQVFARDSGDTRRGRAIASDASFELARIWDLLGEATTAEVQYNASIEGYQRLIDEVPEEPRYRFGIAYAQRDLALLLMQFRRYERIVELLSNAELQLAAALEKEPANPTFRQELVRNLEAQANLAIANGNVREGMKILLTAVPLQEDLVRELPGETSHLKSLVTCHLSLANASSSIDDPSAEGHYRRALTAAEELVVRDPSMPWHRNAISSVQYEFGSFLDRKLRTKEAERYLLDSLESRRTMAADFPTVPEYQVLLATSYERTGTFVRDRLARADEGDQLHLKAIDIRQRLSDSDPSNTSWRLGLAEGCSGYACLLANNSEWQRSEELYRRSISILEELVQKQPSDRTFKTELAIAWYGLGNCRRHLGDPLAKIPWFELSVDALEQELQVEPKSVYVRSNLQLAYRYFARAKKKFGMDAAREWDRAMELLSTDGRWSDRLKRAGILIEASRFDQGLHELEALVADQGEEGMDRIGYYDVASYFSSAAQSLPERKPELHERAIDMLRLSIRKGFCDVTHAEQNDSFDGLRERDDFKSLMKAMATQPPGESEP
jgi:serine/threonine protein kinase